MKLTLQHMRVFLAIAEHGNTSLAASSLNLSQSAARASLNTLETYYGVTLFDRIGKRLELNVLGRKLRVDALRLLDLAKAIDADLKGFKDQGHLRIGASYTIANHLAINWYGHYLARFPNANIELNSGNSPEIIAQLLNAEIEVAMVEAPGSDRRVEWRDWIEDQLVVFCSPAHPLAPSGRLAVSQIDAQRWILREPDSGARQTFNKALDGVGSQRPVYLEFRHNEQIKKAVESGLGIGCLSEKVLQSHFDSGALVALATPFDEQLSRRFYIATLRQRELSAGAQVWLNLCEQLMDGAPSL